jgi:hypothetical protein
LGSNPRANGSSRRFAERRRYLQHEWHMAQIWWWWWSRLFGAGKIIRGDIFLVPTEQLRSVMHFPNARPQTQHHLDWRLESWNPPVTARTLSHVTKCTNNSAM